MSSRIKRSNKHTSTYNIEYKNNAGQTKHRLERRRNIISKKLQTIQH